MGSKRSTNAGSDTGGWQAAYDLFCRGHEYEMRHDLVPARRLAEDAMEAATSASATDVVIRVHQLLGVISHKENNLAATRHHLEAGLALCLDARNTQYEAYARQELGFLLLDEGDAEAARSQFHRVLALAPTTGIINLTGNGLSGTGAALIALGHAEEAVPYLLGALGVRTEINDLEQQHLDLIHLAHAALLLDKKPVAAGIAGFLANSPETNRGCYNHDRRAFTKVLSTVGAAAAVDTFDEARILAASLAT